MFNFYKKLFQMAKKRRTRKRSLSSNVAGLSRRGVTRRRTTRRKRGLSEAFSPATATASAKGMVGGAIGGFGYGLVKPMIDSSTDSKLAQTGIALGLSFIASAVLKMDNISSGIAGAWGFDMSKQISGLQDDSYSMRDNEFADSYSMQDAPEYLDEDGNPMFLADDGNFYYLEEMQDEDDLDNMGEPMFLADATNFYPEYVNTSRY